MNLGIAGQCRVDLSWDFERSKPIGTRGKGGPFEPASLLRERVTEHGERIATGLRWRVVEFQPASKPARGKGGPRIPERRTMPMSTRSSAAVAAPNAYRRVLSPWTTINWPATPAASTCW